MKLLCETNVKQNDIGSRNAGHIYCALIHDTVDLFLSIPLDFFKTTDLGPYNVMHGFYTQK